MREYCFTSLSAQSWQYRDRRKPRSGYVLLLSNNFKISLYSYSAHNHRHNYMHILDDKYPCRPGFKPSTSEFRATIGSNARHRGRLVSVKKASLMFVVNLPLSTPSHLFLVSFLLLLVRHPHHYVPKALKTHTRHIHI